MRAGLAALALAVLTGCATPPPTVFRDTSAPFASISRFEVDRFLGDWQRVAAFVPAGQAVGPQRLRYLRASDGRVIGHASTPDGREAVTAYDLPAPGRLRPAGQGEELWVLWVDEGFRTAVLGTRSGDAAMIIDRGGAPAPDRMRAAREILDWYGYDMTRLQEVAR